MPIRGLGWCDEQAWDRGFSSDSGNRSIGSRKLRKRFLGEASRCGVHERASRRASEASSDIRLTNHAAHRLPTRRSTTNPTALVSSVLIENGFGLTMRRKRAESVGLGVLNRSAKNEESRIGNI